MTMNKFPLGKTHTPNLLSNHNIQSTTSFFWLSSWQALHANCSSLFFIPPNVVLIGITPTHIRWWVKLMAIWEMWFNSVITNNCTTPITRSKIANEAMFSLSCQTELWNTEISCDLTHQRSMPAIPRNKANKSNYYFSTVNPSIKYMQLNKVDSLSQNMMCNMWEHS